LKILLVEPEFPIPSKERNHRSYLPIGLLKLSTYHKKKGDLVKLARGNISLEELGFEPDRIFVTSLFTYWRESVKKSVEHYRSLFPHAKICVGGIYASLMPDDCKEYTGCDDVYVGVHSEAEKVIPDYDMLANPHNLGFQIIHASRGCIRNCKFCGVHRIEPDFSYKRSIKSEIRSNRLVFYDNNILANSHIKDILREIADFKYKGKHVSCESQCGFDARLLTPEIAKLIKKARFLNVRIAWDGPWSDFRKIKKRIDMLVDAGYKSKDIFVFMIYNWDIDFNEMLKKVKKCREWRVQIADCRFRPINQKYDKYSPLKKQTYNDYYIHPKWADELVKRFRRIVRRQNICVRMGFKKYSQKLEARGGRDRGIRRRLMQQLRHFGYNISKIRQVIPVKDGFKVNVRVSKENYEVILSADYQVRSITKRE